MSGTSLRDAPEGAPEGMVSLVQLTVLTAAFTEPGHCKH